MKSSEAIDVIERLRNLSGGHPLGVHGYDFLIDVGDIFLTFSYYLWFKRGLSILGTVNPKSAIAAV